MYNGLGNIERVTSNGNVINFGYTDNTNPDRLTSYNGKSITYNLNGEVASYDGWNYSWNKGKLSSITTTSNARALKPTLSSSKTYSFAYNALGQRITSTYSYLWASNGLTPLEQGEVTSYVKTYHYDYSGRLISETINQTVHGVGNDSESIVFLYDESSIIGIVRTASGATNAYYFQKNLLGDVIAIYDTNGTKIVEYTYDAWGNCTIKSTTTNYVVAHANPIRYRGYYYDENTKLYYLNARYYSPEFRRFISPDNISYLNPESVNGLNLYCYCNNDPINYADPSGHFWDVVFDIGSIIWSAYDLIKNPSWENLGWLTLDIGFASIPFLTGSGGLKAVSKMDDIYDISKITVPADKIYMLGQSMNNRVIPEALNLGVDWYHGLDSFNDIAQVSKPIANLLGYIDNMAFIAKKSLSGARFIDMGFDTTRTISKANLWGELWSRFTIHSERFMAIAFRKKNISRIAWRIYQS